MKIDLHIDSEIEPLRTVLLHRPGLELERLVPQYLDEMLFEDIPFVRAMQSEHDAFARVLRDRGVRVVYYRDLLVDILEMEEVRRELFSAILDETVVGNRITSAGLFEYLLDCPVETAADACIAGVLKQTEGIPEEVRGLVSAVYEEYPYFIPPLPNLYFARDPGAVICNGVAFGAMHAVSRRRESLILEYIMRYHPRLGLQDSRIWYHRDTGVSLEGGDLLVLSPAALAVGCSARTRAPAVEILAERLFSALPALERVVVIQIPFTREYMHLDTILTMVDRDSFAMYREVEDRLNVFILERKRDGYGTTEYGSLRKALAVALGFSSVRLIRTGGGDPNTAAREQWNDSTNTVALAPGSVIAYDRNIVSNEILREAGITVTEIVGSELVRGRGGPRCMTMPLRRGSE